MEDQVGLGRGLGEGEQDTCDVRASISISLRLSVCPDITLVRRSLCQGARSFLPPPPVHPATSEDNFDQFLSFKALQSPFQLHGLELLPDLSSMERQMALEEMR